MKRFEIATPDPFHYERCLEYLNRSPLERSYRVIGQSIYKYHFTEEKGYLLQIKAKSDHLSVQVHNRELSKVEGNQLSQMVRFWFDLDTPLDQFYVSAKEDPIFDPLIQQYRGLRLIKIPDFFEAISWAIIGQQINLTFAYKLKQQFIQTYGPKIEWEGKLHYAFPSPKIIATLSIEQLKSLQFSRQKANYLISIAKSICTHDIPYEQIARMSLKEASATLVSIKGIGPWSAHYVLMRAFQFRNALPVQDVGLRNALKTQLNLNQQPSLEETRTITNQWTDWKGYRTFYLWRSLQNN